MGFLEDFDMLQMHRLWVCADSLARVRLRRLAMRAPERAQRTIEYR
jgi:hypothetical protein